MILLAPHSIVLRLAAAALVLQVLGACAEQRTEYRKRPEFFKKASISELADECVLEDGTIVKFRSPDAQTTAGRAGSGKGQPFQIRQEQADGTIVLRALLPEHVIINTLTCLRNEEYELLYRQLLAEQTRASYESAGKSEEDVAEYFRKNRHDLVAMMTRMVAGLPHEEVSMKPLGAGVTRCRLRPQVGEQFKFKFMDVTREGMDWKLLMIR